MPQINKISNFSISNLKLSNMEKSIQEPEIIPSRKITFKKSSSKLNQVDAQPIRPDQNNLLILDVSDNSLLNRNKSKLSSDVSNNKSSKSLIPCFKVVEFSLNLLCCEANFEHFLVDVNLVNGLKKFMFKQFER